MPELDLKLLRYRCQRRGWRLRAGEHWATVQWSIGTCWGRVAVNLATGRFFGHRRAAKGPAVRFHSGSAELSAKGWFTALRSDIRECVAVSPMGDEEAEALGMLEGT